MKAGFIGLGQMGSGMARNLLKAAHKLTVFNRTASKTAALTTLGARGVTTSPMRAGATPS
jgi:3-hydroxyisobutyrate dehydrogenase-like beta-hydroxyacid dehydrogenase